MAAPKLIKDNTMVKEVRLLRRRHWSTWITIWPFIFFYVIATALYVNPELIWDRVTYLVHQTYIDFAHASFIPFVVFFHTFLSLFTKWSVTFRSRVIFRSVPADKMEAATHVLVIAHVHKGESEIVPLEQESDDGKPTCFIFQQRKWKLDDDTGLFVKPKFPTKHNFSHYMHWDGLNSSSQRERQLDIYGPNKMEITIPEFQDLLVDHAFAPLFVFQMFCVLLWCLDEYWYYSLMTAVMMVGMECTVVFQRINNMKTLRNMAEVPVTMIDVIRGGSHQTVRTDELLPMDIVVVPNNSAFPVDALLIKGTVVVNEASLTGESTPQLKEAPDDAEIELNTKKHGRHMLFCGTQVLLSTGAEKGDSAVAVVLKTGFETKQGKLLRTILHSQGRISENSSEAFAFIGVLVVFALAASGYLLKRGLADPSKNRWKLFLSCIQVITSVVPADLPMELSMAVNSALLTLSKLSIFCTEPFRIPFAGMIDTCCFDKTGTLTTDEMLFGGLDMSDGKGVLNTLKSIPRMSEVVLVSCHSLVCLQDDIVAGDEMEKAALDAFGYRIDDADTVVFDPPQKDKNGKIVISNPKPPKKVQDPRKTIRIRARFPFLAALRRMSCIVESKEGRFVVAKGSPEAIASLCNNMPASALKLAEETASKGFRVIALAHRPLTPADVESANGSLSSLKREDVEKEMSFAGLALYVCPLKKDAKETIENLQGGSHRCTIITGDSVQTAISVGSDVSMLRTGRYLIARAKEGSDEEVEWVENGNVVKATAEEIIAKVRKDVRKKKWFGSGESAAQADAWELCVNAENLSSAQFTHLVETYSEYVTIWARCAPTQKEQIVLDLKKKNHGVMMSGDGTNDVGALKQAHVGIAVLNSASVAPAAGPQTHNEPDLSKDMLLPPNFKLTEVPPKPPQNAPFMEQTKWNITNVKRQAEIQRVIKWNAQLQKQKAEKDAKKAALPPMEGGTSDFMMDSLFNADDEGMGAPMIKLGDASIAAPFTCRSKALTSVCDIIRLGRSTLVTTHMMYKILALNCLNMAYSMSVLVPDGVKLGEKQMIASGMILTVCFMCMSRSKPLERLCPQRPITSIFHPSVFGSVLCQFALHLFCMIKTASMVIAIDSESVAAIKATANDETFKPSLLNSVMFLMNTLQGGVTFAVNYRGEPFMQSIRRNRPMFFALVIMAIMVFYLASEVEPELNEMLEIVPFPSAEFRDQFRNLLVFDALGSYAIECFFLFFFTDA
eukprot:gene10157-7112_t